MSVKKLIISSARMGILSNLVNHVFKYMMESPRVKCSQIVILLVHENFIHKITVAFSLQPPNVSFLHQEMGGAPQIGLYHLHLPQIINVVQIYHFNNKENPSEISCITVTFEAVNVNMERFIIEEVTFVNLGN